MSAFTTGRLARARVTGLALAIALGLAACGQAVAGQDAAAPAGAPAAAPVAAPRAATDAQGNEICEGDGKSAVASIQPKHDAQWYVSNDARVKEIRAANQLDVGTSGDVLLWGARDPQTGKLAGFDIELLQHIANAIKPDLPINYKVINYGDRLPVLAGVDVDGNQKDVGKVDIVAHTMTINCARWNKILFSTEYYKAGQKVLVRTDPTGNGGKGKPLANSLEDLKGQKVCAANGSTNIDNLKAANDQQGLDITTVAVDDLGDCLVKFQQGSADAITGDDTVLAGFAAQDPYAAVVGDQFSAEPYGLGFQPQDTGFVEFVNALLEQWRSDGTLRQIYEDTMGKALPDQAVPAIPKAVYGRTGLVK